MTDITKLTLLETKEKLLKKEFSSKELTQTFIDKIEKEDKYNAYITKNFENAIQKAEECDKNIAKGEVKQLEGLPIAVKDIFCTKGIKTTCGSKILENFIPPYESTVTQKLKRKSFDFPFKYFPKTAFGQMNIKNI